MELTSFFQFQYFFDTLRTMHKKKQNILVSIANTFYVSFNFPYRLKQNLTVYFFSLSICVTQLVVVCFLLVSRRKKKKRKFQLIHVRLNCMQSKILLPLSFTFSHFLDTHNFRSIHWSRHNNVNRALFSLQLFCIVLFFVSTMNTSSFFCRRLRFYLQVCIRYLMQNIPFFIG